MTAMKSKLLSAAVTGAFFALILTGTPLIQTFGVA